MTDYKAILKQPSKRSLFLRDAAALLAVMFLFWYVFSCFVGALDHEQYPNYPAKVRCE